MERCLGCGGDVSTASERKRRRLLGSSTAEKNQEHFNFILLSMSVYKSVFVCLFVCSESVPL